MRGSIQRDLRQTERHESHLWILAFLLLILFGTIVAGHYAVVMFAGDGGEAELNRATTVRAVGGLFFLTVLFCLYVLRVLLESRRMKSLLVEMNGMAASSMKLDDFLPAIARKTAEALAVPTCQIALVAHQRTTLELKAAHAKGNPQWQPRIGAGYPLDKLTFRDRLADTAEPFVLTRSDLEQLPSDEQELVTGRFASAQAILVVPMVTKNRIMGLIFLGQSRGMVRRRFGAARTAAAQTVARYAADAIDQSQLKSDAIRDHLTGLYNRRYFAERVTEELSKAARYQETMAIMLCDLDRFKRVNDTHGHQTGDAVLRTTAHSIQDATRGTDLVFRWGGDEMIILLPKCSRSGASIAADRIRQGVLATAKRLDVDLDVSIGIGLYPEHGMDEDQLIRVADRALYIAKQQRDANAQIGEEEYQLDECSIKAVFQPVVEISSRRIVAHEALMRDPQGKLTPFQLFEKYRGIGRLDELKQIALAMQVEKAKQIGLKRVFVNADFRMLSRTEPIAVPPGMDVVIELSEREALHDLPHHLGVAEKWRAAGYEFAIDDFGAGFISLPFLAMLVPEYVKVDRSTMLQAASSPKFKDCLKSILAGVRSYASAGIIAEGVEKVEELEMTKELGIPLAQGFLLGKPRDLDAEAASRMVLDPLLVQDEAEPVLVEH